MANVYDQAIGSGSAVTIGENARKTEVGNLGIPATRWLKVTSTAPADLHTGYAAKDSAWHQVTAHLQHLGVQIICAETPGSQIALYKVDDNLSGMSNADIQASIQANVSKATNAVVATRTITGETWG
jgi:hypothetical protein